MPNYDEMDDIMVFSDLEEISLSTENPETTKTTSIKSG